MKPFPCLFSLWLHGVPLPTMHIMRNFQKYQTNLPELFVNKWTVYSGVHFEIVHYEGKKFKCVITERFYGFMVIKLFPDLIRSFYQQKFV